MQCFKKKTALDAEVYKVTPHGIFVNVVDKKIQAKIAADKKEPGEIPPVKIGDKLKVVITYLGTSKIIVELV
jgi:ribosomal protein S1